MAYIVKTSFYEGSKLHEEGTVFEHADADFVKKCIEDGNVVEGEVVAPVVEPTPESDDTSDPLAPASVNVESQPPEAPVNQSPTEGVQPTPEDIQKTLSETGLGESSVVIN